MTTFKRPRDFCPLVKSIKRWEATSKKHHAPGGIDQRQPALPALTGRTRVFDQSSNTRVRPVIGQTLSDRSAHQLVGQACPTSAWLVLSDQSGTLLDRCLPIRASWSTGAHRSDQAGRPVCTGQISLIDRYVPVGSAWSTN
ncbi:hypothetical protein PCANC_25866 [Puccinia coronata f. sp. avenae]|uniref:Uncharacterized protein n=1 Tax=Puccinia coronata f. sp. avenae TaxID=200324 RepID=A0A2N5TKF9_9BASI|nr:hypothetical protein PCANC_25866 [Puccinia coronata f. sp. avenae]